MYFSPYLGVLGGGGGLPRGLRHNLLMQFSSLGSSKMEISGTDFLYISTIQNDQICYVKHVLAPLYVFFTLFGCCWGGGWHPRGLEHNLLMKFSNLGSSRMVVPLPSLRCLAEGNRIFFSVFQLPQNSKKLQKESKKIRKVKKNKKNSKDFRKLRRKG